MTEISIGGILAGKAYGHPLRWCKEFLKKHEPSVESCVQSLRDHYKDANLCLQLSSLKLVGPQAATSTDVARLLHDLNGYGEDFPTKMKLAVLEWRLAQCSQKGLYQEYFWAIAPWCAPGSESFCIPHEPMMCAVEGTVSSRCSCFSNKSMTLFAKLVDLGEEGLPAVRSAVNAVLHVCGKRTEMEVASDAEDDEDDEDGKIDKVVDTVAQAAKAILLLTMLGDPKLHSSQLASSQMLFDILAARSLKGQQALASPFHSLSAQLSLTDFYLPKIQLLHNVLVHYKQHLHLIEEAVAAIDNTPIKLLDGTVPPVYAAWIRDTLLPARNNIPVEGHTAVLEEKLMAQISIVLTEGIATCTNGSANGAPAGQGEAEEQQPIDVLEVSKGFRQLLSFSEKAFPQNTYEWRQFAISLGKLQESSLRCSPQFVQCSRVG